MDWWKWDINKEENMDYEKAYKDALERASGFKTQECRDVAEYIFPELKESEDERIKKDIIYFIQSRLSGFPECEKFVSWLEEQGKKPKKVSIWKHWKDGIAGGTEGEQIFLTKMGRIYSISSCLGCECDYIELSELDKLMREEKQGKSNWNEEDEKMFSFIQKKLTS